MFDTVMVLLKEIFEDVNFDSLIGRSYSAKITKLSVSLEAN